MLVVDAEFLGQLAASQRRELVKHPKCAAQQPGRHHVGVRVVVESGLAGVGVARVVFVGPEHTFDDVALAVGVPAGEVGEEVGDRQQQLGPDVVEELVVSGHLPVVPDVEGYGQADVALEVRHIGQPASGSRVEVPLLVLLAPGAAALPREHCAPSALLSCCSARFGETPVPVPDRGTRSIGELVVEQR